MPSNTPALLQFDPEFDIPLYHCPECGRELLRDSCRKCGTDGNPASNWIPNGKKERPSAPLAFAAALAALDVEENLHPDRMEVTHTILGLDAVRAAHRAEVERAVAEERARCMADCDAVKARIPADANDDTAYAFRGGADACRAAIRARGAKS